MDPLRRAFLLLAVTAFTLQFSSGINRSVQNNFFVEDLALRADQMGLLTTVREIPGFLMVLIAAAGLRLLAPNWLAALALIVMGIGYGAYSLADSFGSLLVVSLIGSLGFHTWMPLSGTLNLAIASKANVGRVQGRLLAIGSAGAVLSMVVVFLVVGTVGYRVSLALSGVVMVMGALAIVQFPAELAQRPKQRIVVRRRYSLFYLLNFLDGCRSEVFLAFGVFLLVKQYAVDVQTITLLLLVSSILSVTMSHRVGTWIDTLGERRVLTFSYAAHFLTFLGFAFIHDRQVAILLYVVYNFLLLFNMGVSSYLKRIADPADIGPSMALAVTNIHISAMIVPLVGGFLWQRYGFQAPFIMGSVFILVSVLATQRLPTRRAVGPATA